MRLCDVLSIYIGMQDYPYSPVADALLEAFMAEGTVMHIEPDYMFIHVQYHGKNYAVVGLGRYSFDLSSAYEVDSRGVFRTLYSEKRPSRKVKHRFWRWVEDSGYTIAGNAEPLGCNADSAAVFA